MALFNQVVVTTFLIAVFISACMGVDDEPTDQSIDQPINQTIDHPINQPTASSRNLIKRSTRDRHDRDCTTDKNSFGKKCLCTQPCTYNYKGNMMCYTYGDRRKRSYCCKEPCKRYYTGLWGIKEYKCNAGRKLVTCDPRKTTFEPWPKPTFSAFSVSSDSDDYQHSFLLDSSSSPDYSSSSLGGPSSSSSRSSLVSIRFMGPNWSELARENDNYLPFFMADDHVKPSKWVKVCVGRKCKNEENWW